MGFSTNITISNDFWHDIAKKPQALVDSISVAMNEGTDSPIAQAFEANDARASYRDYVRREVPYGVTVHRAQHNDVPQVIVNTYGSHAISAHELPTAIANGWLDCNKYNEHHAEAVAKELHQLAARIRKSVRDRKKLERK